MREDPTVKLVRQDCFPVMEKTGRQGTKINFMPDGEIFEKTRFKQNGSKHVSMEQPSIPDFPSITRTRAGEAEKITAHTASREDTGYVKELNSTDIGPVSRFILKGTSENISG